MDAFVLGSDAMVGMEDAEIQDLVLTVVKEVSVSEMLLPWELVPAHTQATNLTSCLHMAVSRWSAKV